MNIFIIYCVCLTFVNLSTAPNTRLVDVERTEFQKHDQNERSCTTLNNQPGECIAIQKCRPLQKPLSSSLSSENQDFLAQSECGLNGTTQLVCCPNKFTVDDLPEPGKGCGPYVSSISDFLLKTLRIRLYNAILTVRTNFDIRHDTSTSLFSALLLYTKPNVDLKQSSCAGALINQNYVITAAHCLHGYQLAKFGYTLDSVRLGEHDLRTTIDCMENDCADPPVDIQIAETIIHEDYVTQTGLRANDIGLIRLARSVTPFTDYIRPICLPIANNLRNIHYQRMLVSGYGRGSDLTVRGQSRVNAYSSEECLNFYKNLTDSQMCAHGSLICFGSSGGPLISTTKEIVDVPEDLFPDPYVILIGIHSFGPPLCKPNSPAFFTRVDHYIDWILDHMKK